MKLASYVGRDGPGFGRIENDAIVPMGNDLHAFLNGSGISEGSALPLADVTIQAPVQDPQKIVCVGHNYRDHAAESGAPIPTEPILFAKFANSVIGHGDVIILPIAAPAQVDYEAELCVVIGHEAHAIGVDEALSYVAGYTCANDVSARDIQLSTSQWTRGKAVDTFLPLGPWLVTTDEIPDPQHLAIRCTLNGSTVQDSNTEYMIFGVAELVSFISQTMTLSPGDLIATGTPPGVGFVRNPPLFLHDGDEITVDIEGIGTLSNRVAAGG